MSHERSHRLSFPLPRLLALTAGLGLLAAPLGAADKEPTVIGKVGSEEGTVLQRKPGDKQFTPLKKGADLFSSSMTLGMTGSIINSKDGAVQMKLMTDLEGTSKYPILEAAALFHVPDKDVDLDFDLDRGRATLENTKEKGKAVVRVHMRNHVWDITLDEPKTLIGLEVYGRWPRGVFWEKKAATNEAPTTYLTLLVLNGNVELKHGKQTHAMKAPPGPALFHWDSAGGEAAGPERLEELPDWAKPGAQLSPEAKKKLEVAARLRAEILKVGPDAALEKVLKGDDKDLHRLAVIALGATDNVPALIDLLSNDKHDIREDAILTLRHFIGRGPGQDEKVYEALLKKKYTEGQTDIIMHLLHTPGPNELSQAALWEAALSYLKHEKIAIRELMAFHLERILPEDSKKVKYDAGASKEQLEAFYKEWKKIIPDDTVPEKFRPKKEKEKGKDKGKDEK